jgi:hypothetical protein
MGVKFGKSPIEAFVFRAVEPLDYQLLGLSKLSSEERLGWLQI